jgi:hypothetical protein
MNTFSGKFRDRGELILAVLDWVLDEHMSGRTPNTVDVANHFDMSIEESDKLYDELKDMGEFD